VSPVIKGVKIQGFLTVYNPMYFPGESMAKNVKKMARLGQMSENLSGVFPASEKKNLPTGRTGGKGPVRASRNG
jgi:hypothetical protein